MKKLFPQFAVGALLSQILGVIGLLTMATYGGRNGCFEWTNKLFNLSGYESCGDLGGSVGLIVGAVFGVWIVYKMKKSLNGIIVAVIAGLALIIPLAMPIAGILREQSFEIGNLFDLLKFWSVIFAPALIVTGIFNFKQIFRKS